MINNKELIEEFEKEFFWFGFNNNIKVEEENKFTIVFNEKGFSYYDNIGIEYTLNEMDETMLLVVSQNLIKFMSLIMLHLNNKMGNKNGK